MYLKKLQISYDKSEDQLSDTVPEGIYLGYITGIPAKIVTWYIKIVEKKDLNTFWRKKNLERFTEEFLEEPTVKCLWNHWLNNWRHCGMNSCKSECMNFWKKSWGSWMSDWCSLNYYHWFQYVGIPDKIYGKILEYQKEFIKYSWRSHGKNIQRIPTIPRYITVLIF